jgi:hypothetical protein
MATLHIEHAITDFAWKAAFDRFADMHSSQGLIITASNAPLKTLGTLLSILISGPPRRREVPRLLQTRSGRRLTARPPSPARRRPGSDLVEER